MKDRIKKIRKSFPEYGETQETFAKFLGIPKSNLSSYESGRRTPSDAVVQLICEKCNTNEEWLRNGTGDMFIDEDEEFEEFSYICGKIGATDEKAKRAIMNYWQLSPDDRKLFWKFIETIVNGKEEVI